MDAGSLALLIPILGMSIPIIAIWTRHRQKIAEMEIHATAELSAEKAAQYASQVKELEQRVRVLERIVTDKGYNVASQIKALRDTRKMETLQRGRQIEGID
ncbi:MAG TPA: hypothetical protein VL094_03745 [Sphingomonadaceae bacterium]|nr:hypothetical protein [Sphingomonadaceae bacterium]